VRRAWVVAGLSVVLASGCGPPKTDWPRVATPAPAPDFVLPQVDAQPVRLSDFRGQVVILEFWATWCVPCRYSTPSLQKIYEEYRDRGVTVLLVNAGETEEVAREWIKDWALTMPVLLDRDGRAGWSYRVESVPKLFIIDQAGQILYVRSGYGGKLERNLRAILHELLADAA
jgi:peroxiredoxin